VTRSPKVVSSVAFLALLLVQAGPAQAGPVLIDDFSTPSNTSARVGVGVPPLPNGHVAASSVGYRGRFKGELVSAKSSRQWVWVLAAGT
jgi:hypothetical protein